MECQAISLEEKYLIERYNELEKKEDQVFAFLLSRDLPEEYHGEILQLKRIDQIQDQIMVKLLERENQQIAGHVHLNKRLGRIKNVQILEDDLLSIA